MRNKPGRPQVFAKAFKHARENTSIAQAGMREANSGCAGSAAAQGLHFNSRPAPGGEAGSDGEGLPASSVSPNNRPKTSNEAWPLSPDGRCVILVSNIRTGRYNAGVAKDAKPKRRRPIWSLVAVVLLTAICATALLNRDEFSFLYRYDPKVYAVHQPRQAPGSTDMTMELLIFPKRTADSVLPALRRKLTARMGYRVRDYPGKDFDSTTFDKGSGLLVQGVSYATEGGIAALSPEMVTPPPAIEHGGCLVIVMREMTWFEKATARVRGWCHLK
jgi:hypothetical protein